MQVLAKAYPTNTNDHVVYVNTWTNCTAQPAISHTQALAVTAEKSADAVIFEGNGQEHSKPILYSLLGKWSPKLRVGGIAMGKDYGVSTPYLMKYHSISPTFNERATKLVLEAYRTGDENELGQDDILNIAGDSVWYFIKKKPSIFG